MFNVYVASYAKDGSVQWIHDPEYTESTKSIWFSKHAWIDVNTAEHTDKTLDDYVRKAYDLLDQLHIVWSAAIGISPQAICVPIGDKIVKRTCFPFKLLEPLPYDTAKQFSGLRSSPSGFSICHGGTR